MRVALQEMGHQQPKTPLVTDNKLAEGLINKTMTSKASKNYDLRFNLLKCRDAQKQFDLIWKKGSDNRADFHTKNHPTKVYTEQSGNYIVAPAA